MFYQYDVGIHSHEYVNILKLMETHIHDLFLTKNLEDIGIHSFHEIKLQE